MPWLETEPVDQRQSFIDAWLRGGVSITTLCRMHGISRKTGHKFIGRYKALGQAGLEDASRAPREIPHRMSNEVAAAICSTRAKYPSWGPRKILSWLAEHQPGLPLPAASTAGDLLKALGLTVPRKRRNRVPAYGQPFKGVVAPNDTWCADFKGDFLVGKQRCIPLTIMDAHSRFLLCCQGLLRTAGEIVKPYFERAFRENGLPRAIRTDNGAPFASRAHGGLSKLAIWWVRLGIVPERIEAGKPEQNGRHERMHLTLKRETALDPRPTMQAQQAVFDRFRAEYNHERPHEALGQKPPASAYAQSPRPYPDRLPRIEYPPTLSVRRVLADGTFGWQGKRIFLSEVLEQQDIGLEEIEADVWRVLFGSVELGYLDASGRVFRGGDWTSRQGSALRVLSKYGKIRGNNGTRHV